MMPALGQGSRLRTPNNYSKLFHIPITQNCQSEQGRYPLDSSGSVTNITKPYRGLVDLICPDVVENSICMSGRMESGRLAPHG